MAIDVFRLRSKERDEKNDRFRLEAVMHTVEKARQEVVREAEGLRARFKAAQADAAFSFNNMENEGLGHGMTQRLTRLEHSVLYYERRIRELDAQANALYEIGSVAREKLSLLLRQNQ